jgi:hypothetical protein
VKIAPGLTTVPILEDTPLANFAEHPSLRLIPLQSLRFRLAEGFLEATYMGYYKDNGDLVVINKDGIKRVKLGMLTRLEASGKSSFGIWEDVKSLRPGDYVNLLVNRGTDEKGPFVNIGGRVVSAKDFNLAIQVAEADSMGYPGQKLPAPGTIYKLPAQGETLEKWTRIIDIPVNR